MFPLVSSACAWPPADPLKFQAGLEVLALCDYSLSIKAGVHFTLCGGAIAKLGTQKHFDALFERLDTLDLPGCFGMTELGHGSNVLGIQTQVGRQHGMPPSPGPGRPPQPCHRNKVVLFKLLPALLCRTVHFVTSHALEFAGPATCAM